jgi:hypothetical protein
VHVFLTGGRYGSDSSMVRNRRATTRPDQLATGSAILFGLVAVGLGPAYGALDEAATLFEKAGRKRAEETLDTLSAAGELRTPDASPRPLWRGFRFGDAHVMELGLDGTNERTWTRGRRRWTTSTGPTPRRIPPDPWLTFVAHNRPDPNGQRGLAFLEAHGIDSAVVSLSRQERRPAYVIGAKPWQPDRPQLWLDKESLMPVRWVRLDGDTLVETRFLGFAGPVTGPFFPRRIEVRADGSLIRTEVYDRVEPNAPMDDRRFQPPR